MEKELSTEYQKTAQVINPLGGKIREVILV
jgi:hypothetical protein